MSRLITIIIELYPIISGISGLVVACLCVISYPSLYEKINSFLIKVKISSKLVSHGITSSIYMTVILAIALSAINSVGDTFFSVKCDDISFYRKMSDRGIDGIEAFIKLCPTSKHIYEAKANNIKMSYRKATNCIASNNCLALECATEFEQKFGHGVEVDLIRRTAIDVHSKSICNVIDSNISKSDNLRSPSVKNLNTSNISKNFNPCVDHAGEFTVQVGSKDSYDESEYLLDNLRVKHKEILDKCTLLTVQANVGGKIFFRSRIGKLKRESAMELCGSLQSVGVPCFVAKI